jgi:4-hydroxyphenylpyruvate dioxygenase
MSKIENVEYGLEKIFEEAQDFLPLLGTDYVEFIVGNAKQAAHFYKTAFGFQSYAYKGLETGCKEYASYVVKQDKIRIVLTTPLNQDSWMNDHLSKHGLMTLKNRGKKRPKEAQNLIWNQRLKKTNMAK